MPNSFENGAFFSSHFLFLRVILFLAAVDAGGERHRRGSALEVFPTFVRKRRRALLVQALLQNRRSVEYQKVGRCNFAIRLSCLHDDKTVVAYSLTAENVVSLHKNYAAVGFGRRRYGAFPPQDFKIQYFAINVLVEKMLFSQFRSW